MEKFKAEIKIIGVNPFVFIPAKVLTVILNQAGKDKGYIPVCGTINAEPYRQTPPSRQLEIVRYISFLKTEESVDRNIIRAIDFLTGKGRFVGRDKP